MTIGRALIVVALLIIVAALLDVVHIPLSAAVVIATILGLIGALID